MRYLIISLALLLFPLDALARDVTISWVPPTERTDGTAFTTEEINGYWFSCRAGEADHVDVLWIEGAGVEASSNLNDLLPSYGTYQCSLRVEDTLGLQSARSNEVEVVHASAPGAPGELRLEFDLKITTNVTGTVSLVTD